MITSVQELAKAMGSRSKDPFVCKQDIMHMVETHTKGIVTVFFYPEDTIMLIRNTQGLSFDETLSFPLSSEDFFWRAVEWIEEETNGHDEDDDVDVFATFSVRNTRPHEFYD